MAGYRRTIATATAGLAAVGAIAAAVAMTHNSGGQGAQSAANVASGPVLGLPSAARGSFLRRLDAVKTIASTVPFNGDVNPYGIAVINHSSGQLQAGNILVSNYNDKANLQGTGTTIVEISPAGRQRVFAHITTATVSSRACPGGIGLSTALSVLPDGWVAIGSAPSANGQIATAKAGCVLLLNSYGQVKETLTGAAINGPWDSTAVNFGQFSQLFVTNTFNGTAAARNNVVRRGTVTRITLQLSRFRAPRVLDVTTVASGLAEQGSAAAFVLGPTGVAVSGNGTLYIADTVTNRITAVPRALTRRSSGGTGFTVTSGGALNQPLGLALTARGDILTVNGGDGKVVETTPRGHQIGTTFLDTTAGSPVGAGALFGIAVTPNGTVYYTDDVANTLRLLH